MLKIFRRKNTLKDKNRNGNICEFTNSLIQIESAKELISWALEAKDEEIKDAHLEIAMKHLDKGIEEFVKWKTKNLYQK